MITELMSIFEYADYRPYLRERIQKLPKKGRGEIQRMAEALEMHTSSVSQIFKGIKRFTPEQACKLSVHLGLNDIESEYLQNLVEKERAGTKMLEARIEQRLNKLRVSGGQLEHRLPHDQNLSDSEKALFYSNWFYSALRLATDIPELRSIEALAAHFLLPPILVNEVMQFLVSCGLCIEDNGHFKMGPHRTHLAAASPLVGRHHMNWRMKAIERSPKLDQFEELQLSAPVVLSKADAARIRNRLLLEIQEVLKVVSPSKSEIVYCLNVDWIQIG